MCDRICYEVEGQVTDDKLNRDALRQQGATHWEERNQGSGLADEEKNYWPVVMGLLCLVCHFEWVGRSAFLKCVINFALWLWRPHGEKEKCLRGLLRLLHPSWRVSIETHTHTHNNTNTHTEHITNHTKPGTINFPCDKHKVTNIHQSIIFNRLQCKTQCHINLCVIVFTCVGLSHLRTLATKPSWKTSRNLVPNMASVFTQNRRMKGSIHYISFL